MTTPVRLVLGFDTRERFVPREALFPASRVQRFLLVEDCEKPLSTDVRVWPTVFTNPNVDRLGLHAFALGRRGVPLPESAGPLQDLWLSLDEMNAALRAGTLQGPATTLAITVDETWRSPLGTGPTSPIGETDPAELDDGWTFLGFDVSDRFLVSVLMNFSYPGETKEDVRRTWAPHLNRRHLFHDAATAVSFARASEARVGKRGPFSVYGLWERS